MTFASSPSKELAATAKALVAPGKGILAADECAVTMANRFQRIGVENTLEARREYRSFALSTPGLAEYVSGVILVEETLRQSTIDGTPFVDLLARQGILPGINVDGGLAPLPGSSREWVTEGLDGLSARLRTYRDLGARFAKWRALIAVGDDLPTDKAVLANAQALARYAAASQEAGLVPIVEPEVSMDGAHTARRCQEVSERALRAVFDQLAVFDVALDGILLKTNMVIAGSSCPEQASTGEVAERTLACLDRTVPPAVPGIVFLSGGQSTLEATERLGAITKRRPNAPWELGFAYGRALQGEALEAWGGKRENAAACRQALFTRAQLLGAARFGKYDASLETR